MDQLTGTGISRARRLVYGLGLFPASSRHLVRARSSFLNPLFERFGEGAEVSHRVKLLEPGRIRLGTKTRIGNSTILDGRGGLTIGRDCMIGFENIVLTQSHGHDEVAVPMRQQAHVRSPVEIGDDVWTGCRVIILPGATIGAHSIVGAGAVVAGSIPPYAIVAGVPARVIGTRR